MISNERSAERQYASTSHKHVHQFSPSYTSKPLTSDPDPFNIVIVEDLLQGINEWRNIQDIIRLSFKALTDIVRSQGEAIVNIDKQVQQKVSRQELKQQLDKKQNAEDSVRSVQELYTLLERKASTEECTQIVRDFVQRQEREAHSETALRYEDFQKQINRTLAQEVAALTQQLAQKADLHETTEALEGKASKQTVSNALHRKANRADIDLLLARKAESHELQAIQNALDTKADLVQFERILPVIESKVDEKQLQLALQSLQVRGDARERSDAQIYAKLEGVRNECEARSHDLFAQLKNELDGIRGALQRKGEVKDLEALYAQVELLHARKDELRVQLEELRAHSQALIAELSGEVGALRTRAEEQALAGVRQNEHALTLFKEDLLTRINELARSFAEDKARTHDETAKLVRTTGNAIKKDLQRENEEAQREILLLRKELEEKVKTLVQEEEYDTFRQNVQAAMEEKVDLAEVQSALNTSQRDLSQRFQEFNQETEVQLKALENDIIALLNTKANTKDVHDQLATKIDVHGLQSLLHKQARKEELEELQFNLENLKQSLQDKVDYSEFQSQNAVIIRKLDDLESELIKKANVKEIINILDAKSSIEDFQRFVGNVQRELSLKAGSEELQSYIQDQSVINESLCTENIIGRWTWKSGDVKSGSLIPWEVQVVNTLPDNFLWERDKTNILVSAPGLYEKFQIQITVNGEPILTSLSSSSGGNAGSSTLSGNLSVNSSKFKDHKHSAGQLTGLTIVEFVILPARARVSTVYQGEHGAEGFISLKRI